VGHAAAVLARVSLGFAAATAAKPRSSEAELNRELREAVWLCLCSATKTTWTPSLFSYKKYPQRHN
jgi:hypothetical protein